MPQCRGHVVRVQVIIKMFFWMADLGVKCELSNTQANANCVCVASYVAPSGLQVNSI